MQNPTVVLTEYDRKLLESYKNLAEGLANYLGEGYEFVLHSMESLENSVIKIINGHHTGRKEGSPITDLGLYLLANIKENPEKTYISYFNQNKKGEPLKSCTIPIKGENNQIIGMLCINFYLNTPFNTVLQNYIPTEDSALNEQIAESLVENVDDLIKEALGEVRQKVYNDFTISASNKNKEIINQLYDKGIFKIKDSVLKISNMLGISKNTVYMHIRNHTSNK